MTSAPASLLSRLSGPTVSGSRKTNPALASEMAAPVCKERVHVCTYMSVYTRERLIAGLCGHTLISVLTAISTSPLPATACKAFC